MHAVIAARDARGARNAVSIAISPRDLAPTASELHDATLAHEPSFVAIEHAEDARVRNAIDVADDALTPTARDPHAGIRAEIIKATRCSCGAKMARIAPQPLRHCDIDERTQRAIDEQQRIASRGP